MFKKELIKEYIKSGFDRQSAEAEIDFVCSIEFGLSPVDIMLEKNIPSDFEKRLSKIVSERLKTGRPIQQIVKKAYFLNEKYTVNENVLIPRPETELRVVKAKGISEKEHFKTFLDIGTGSGCISVSLLKLCPFLNGASVDISEKALEVAKQNAILHEVSDRLMLKQSDLFENVEGKFDLIVSNPPYIPKREKPFLQKEVRDFEPEGALFAEDEEGIEFYKKIISKAPSYLNKGGYLMFETGCNQGGLLKELFEKHMFKGFELIKDFDNNDRIVLGQLV